MARCGAEVRRLLALHVLLWAVGPGVTFLGDAVIAVLALLFFVRSFVTETKDRSLEEIEADLQQRSVTT